MQIFLHIFMKFLHFTQTFFVLTKNERLPGQLVWQICYFFNRDVKKY